MDDKVKDPKDPRGQNEKHPFPPGDKEHGEGNYKAAREYDEATRDFAKSGKVEKAAKAAQPRSNRDAEEMEKAEADGRSRSKGEDRGGSHGH